MIWKDTTSYSRNDKTRQPTTYAARAGDLHITVTCGHIYYRGVWIMHCEPFYREHILGVDTLEQAQAKAIELIRVKIDKVARAME